MLRALTRPQHSQNLVFPDVVATGDHIGRVNDEDVDNYVDKCSNLWIT
jgi:hypothetical protein